MSDYKFRNDFIPEFFVNEISRVERCWGNVRLTYAGLYVPMLEHEGEPDRMDKVRLIMPVASVRRMSMQSAEAALRAEFDLSDGCAWN
jgi:hypothetical protein